MEKRRLGRTEHMSTVVIFGGVALASVEQSIADQTMDLVWARGVNHIDIAPSYGDAEAKLGPWFESCRDKFFLGCKTGERGRAGAWRELHESLGRLRTDKFDLYQLHAVTSMEELDKAFAPDGAIEALKQARDEGLTRYLGITGHGWEAPAIQIEALNRFDFDTVMFPINPNLFANPGYRRDTGRLLAEAEARDVGVMIIKSIAKQPWGERERFYDPWYEPHDEQDRIDEGVHFALSQPNVTGVASSGDTRLFPKILEAGESFEPMSKKVQEALIEKWGQLEAIF
ncbi:MAG: aldo/keto reductase [Anaerolineae bacterium]|nr:aldo/keto reductase [Anaerolineae bacterium]